MTSPYATKCRERRRRNNGDSRLPGARIDQRMSVIPTGENFASCYMELCKQQRIRPLPVICVTLPRCLDFTTDRVKMDDWGPILNSLSLDRSLHSISIRSRYQCRKPLEEMNSEDKVRRMGKSPIVMTRYLLEWLSHSVSQCVRNSPVLRSLELEGICLPADCLATLCIGLASTVSLEHLSLQRCYIGDKSCELVCRTVADVQSIRSLNLSHCDLSSNCGPSLAAALSRQKLSLYHDTWKLSLRYREPNLEAMPGLRRLTLNGNPRLGDAAVVELLEAIRDSLWLKAVDLQQCGLTDETGKEIVQLLENNKTLLVVDVRMNPNIQDEYVEQIYSRLAINNAANENSDYRWLSLPIRNSRNVVSAGPGPKNRREKSAVNANRPKSAFVPTRNRPVVRNAVKESRTAAVGFANRKNPSKNISQEKRPKPKTPSIEAETRKDRMSLRVDLDALMQGTVEKTNVDSPVESSSAPSLKEKPLSNDRSNDVEKLNEMLQQLSEARMEHDRLIDETRRTEMLLQDERSRRESAENKLELTRRELVELEQELAEKKMETRGLLLISQRSLDDMAESFDRVLEMLDHVMIGSPMFEERREDGEDEKHGKMARQDYSKARAEMRRRVARLIRKTKSESHALLRVECDETGIIEASVDVAGARKFAKSEGDMRNSLPPAVQPIRLERNVGDSPDVVSSSQHRSRVHEMAEYKKMPSSPPAHARARALLAEVVNGKPFIRHGPHDT